MSAIVELMSRVAADSRVTNAGIRILDGDEVEHRETYGKPGEPVAYFRDVIEADDQWSDGGDRTKLYAWAPYEVEVLTFANAGESGRRPTVREQNDYARDVAGIIARCIQIHGNKIGAERRNMKGRFANDPTDSGTDIAGSRYLLTFELRRTVFDTKATLEKADGLDRTAKPALTGNGEEGC